MHAALRIIDANANRAREALRVMEDVARFGLDDPELSSMGKSLRHDLRAALEEVGLTRGVLLGSRDTAGDVGTTITTEAETSRADLRSVAQAAGARLGEALRAIEESAKVLGRSAAGIEALRYRTYEFDRRLEAALTRAACRWQLCVLISEELCRHHSWQVVAERAIEGGADCLQLREKTLAGGELVRRAKELVALAGGRAAVVINDRVDVAVASGADGVHVGQTDLSVSDCRRIGGDRLIVGVSASSVEQARGAVEQGADLIGVGAMFETSTKAKPSIAGPELLRAVEADAVASRVPRLAIGGIVPENAGTLREMSADQPGFGIAVSSVVCGAEDPAGACRKLL